MNERKLTDFNYTISGPDGAPWLILLHGLLGSEKNWQKVLPAFESFYSVLNIDQRGHGKSLRPAEGYAPQDFAEDIHFIMHELKIEKASVIGHSMGGRNALMLAHMYPNHVESLIMEDIGPESTYESGLGLLARLKRIPAPFKNKRAAKEFLLNDFGDPQLGTFLYTRFIETPEGFTWDFPMSMVEEILSKGRSKDLWEEVRSLNCPTLVLRGERSKELKQEELERMISINPNISGVVIPGAGHWIHFEKPNEFTEQVSEFLADSWV